MAETPTPESESSQRRHKARERHERRKQQKTSVPARVNLPRQIKPAGGFSLPRINLPVSRLVLYGAAALIFLVAVIAFIGRLNPPDDNSASNAIWIGTQYTYDAANDVAAIESLVTRLRDHRIGSAYAWVSLLQPNNTWTDVERLAQPQAFARQFKASYPESMLYGWLSIGSQGADGNNRLGDAQVQQQIADFSRRVVRDFGFDGIMINVVPITGSDDNFLAVLRKIRATIGEGVPMAVAVPPDWTPTDAEIAIPRLIAPGTVWDTQYKQRVSLLADQLVITAYNSGFSDADEYSAWMAYQVEVFASAVAALEEDTTEILMGVPAYDGQPPMHDPLVENVENAIAGIRAGLSGAGDAAARVRGVALYAEWQMTDADWAALKSLWP